MSSYSFELVRVEIDHPMLEYAAYPLQGEGQLTLAFWDYRSVCTKAVLMNVTAVRCREVTALDFPDTTYEEELNERAFAMDFIGMDGARQACVVAASAALVHHNLDRTIRVAFDFGTVLASPTTRLIHRWNGIVPQEYRFPPDLFA